MARDRTRSPNHRETPAVSALGVWRSGVKRAVDLLIAIPGLVLLAVFVAPVALAIYLDDRGPILYRQTRLGIGDRPFTLVKFRTMTTNAEQAGPAWASGNDPRVTRVGRLLRRVWIDEMPQFLNVLTGRMSIVGPRPERPEFEPLLLQSMPDWPLRRRVKPGLTGLAQTEAGYASCLDGSAEKLRLDLIYIENQSLTLDMQVMAKTLTTLVRQTMPRRPESQIVELGDPAFVRAGSSDADAG